MPVLCDGWVEFEGVMSLREMRQLEATNDEVIRVVQECPQQRFEIWHSDRTLWIIAKWGRTDNSAPEPQE